MSGAEAFYVHYVLQRAKVLCYLRTLVKQGVWCTDSGDELSISGMSTSHILNSMSMLKRHYSEYDTDRQEIAEQYISLFSAELEKRYPREDPAIMNG